MKTGRVIHQQVVQLRWHFLACLGLLMALPIEEGFINVKDGEGFYASVLSLVWPITVAPLLAGLMACANVQADLDEKRYIFWRSKPVGVKSFMAIKFFAGLLIAFVVISLPILFAWVTSSIADAEKIETGFTAYMINFMVISLAAYSLCFFCNVLVRKTARAWLIGMAMTVFLLLVPFILPLSFKDMTSDFLFAASVVYFSITLIPSLIAFIASLVAASRNWHLQTNLKGLLWTGAALIFLVMLLFTRQVANIKVLDEVEISKDFYYSRNLQQLYDRTQEGHLLEIETTKGKIEFDDVYREPSEETLEQQKNATRLYPVQKEYELDIYPTFHGLTFGDGENKFTFKLITYSHREEIRKNTYYEKLKEAYLCGYKLLEGLYPVPVSVLDLSDCVDKEHSRKVVMRHIDDKLVILLQDSYAVVQIEPDGGLELLDKQVNGLKGYSRSLRYRDKEFKIPLIPISSINIQERIKLSIDINYRFYHVYSSWRIDENFYRHTLVDINGKEIGFCLLTENEIVRFNVNRWDDEFVYCKFRDARPFTFFEQMFGQIIERDPWFIENGKLYAHENWKLIVVDVRSDSIRKLGHFQRISEDFEIQDIEVLDNGNILMATETEKRIREKRSAEGHLTSYVGRKRYLSLLKNPE
jgi:hypothetical protein